MADRGGLGFLKKIKTLTAKKGRATQGLFMVEGEKFVREIPSDWLVDYFIVSASYLAAKGSVSELEQRAATVWLEDDYFKQLSDTQTPQGIVGICEKKEYRLADMLSDHCLLLLGEALSDPGNVGAFIRTADAAGADGVIFTSGSAEIYNPKVIRAAAGSIFHLPLLENTDGTAVINRLKRNGVLCVAAHLQAEQLLYHLDMKKACCVMIGSEARGLTDALSESADKRIKIPMHPRCQSLNAAIAGGICLYEAVRQRRH
jgi:TrmH family RNA methyltransferase